MKRRTVGKAVIRIFCFGVCGSDVQDALEALAVIFDKFADSSGLD